jgi:hypothetical protein
LVFTGIWRHRATSRNVAGSNPDGANGIIHSHNPSGRSVVLGVDSNLNRNEYQEYFLGGGGGVRAAGAWGWQTYRLYVPLVRNLSASFCTIYKFVDGLFFLWENQ